MLFKFSFKNQRRHETHRYLKQRLTLFGSFRVISDVSDKSPNIATRFGYDEHQLRWRHRWRWRSAARAAWRMHSTWFARWRTMRISIGRALLSILFVAERFTFTCCLRCQLFAYSDRLYPCKLSSNFQFVSIYIYHRICIIEGNEGSWWVTMVQYRLFTSI